MYVYYLLSDELDYELYIRSSIIEAKADVKRSILRELLRAEHQSTVSDPDFVLEQRIDAGKHNMLRISLRRNSSHICGGSILNPTHVLTAAHCVCNTETRMFCIDTNKFSLTCKITKPLSSSLFSIQHGLLKITDKPVNTIDVKNVYCHKFDTSSLTYDAAVLELDSPIPPGQGLPVMLSPHYIADKEHIGTIIGWGKLSHDGGISEVLQKMKVEIYDEKTCGKKFNNDHHICFGSPFGGACNGDSGSALLIGGKQVGIASFITDKCGIANEEHPNVYSKVATYFDWIMETAKMKPSLHHE